MFGQNKQKFPKKKPLALNNNLYEGKIKHLQKCQRINSVQSVSFMLCALSQTSNFLELALLHQSWRLKNYGMEWRTLSSSHIAGVYKRADMSLLPPENLNDWNPFRPILRR